MHVVRVTSWLPGFAPFYERHPISSQIILAKLNASRGHLNDVAPEELFPHDQDHYGGLDANDALVQRAGIGKGTRVDFCAGLGGPARYLAHRPTRPTPRSMKNLILISFATSRRSPPSVALPLSW